MNKYFESNNYKTQKARRSLIDILFLGTRWGFYYKFFLMLLKYRKIARNGVFGPEEWADSSFDLFTTIEKFGGKFEITGLENIINKPDRPAIFISNHMSSLETLVLPGMIVPYRPLVFVVKEALVKNVLFKEIALSSDPIAVPKEASRGDLVRMINGAAQKLRQGVNVVIYPQATRQMDFERDKFSSIGVKIAQKAGAEVIPVAVKTDFWSIGKRFKEFGPIKKDKTIHLAFGAPMDPKKDWMAVHENVCDFIDNALERWSKGA